jgi:hypothetical protein
MVQPDATFCLKKAVRVAPLKSEIYRHASAPGGAASLFHSYKDEHCLATIELAASAQSSLNTAHPSFVNLDFAAQPLACQVDHGPTELVQQPRRLITRQCKLAL